MKLSERGTDHQLDELLPAIGGAAKAVGGAIGGAVKGAAAIGKAMGGIGSAMAGVAQDPQVQAKLAAQQMADIQAKKKEIQDTIKAKQKEIADLQKQLSQLR